MKRLFVLIACAVSLSAFASGEPAKPKATVIQVPAGSKVTVVTAPSSAPASVMVQGERPATERIPFRAGISTVTVEKMAQALGCVGGEGAGLTTPQGPVETYRMVCESGQLYMARCELRQCRTISATPPGGYGAMTAGAETERRQILRRTEVPALAIDWRCGNCTRDEAFAQALRNAYAAEARKYGMAVSDSATATVSVHQFSKKVFPLRSSLGMRAVYGKTSVSVQESTTAFTGATMLATNAGIKLFQGIRGRTY